MLITTIKYLPNTDIKENFGMVSGTTVQGNKIKQSLFKNLQNMFKQDLSYFADHLAESRDEAIAYMKEDAHYFGANAILDIKFSTISLSSTKTEICVSGTAVRMA